MFVLIKEKEGHTKEEMRPRMALLLGTELYTMGYRALPCTALKISKQNSFITD